jgi:hypothetical protein
LNDFDAFTLLLHFRYINIYLYPTNHAPYIIENEEWLHVLLIELELKAYDVTVEQLNLYNKNSY